MRGRQGGTTMGTSRAGQWIVGCCGAAIVVAAAGVVIVGVQSKDRNGGHGGSASEPVPAKFGPAEPGVPVNPSSQEGTAGGRPRPVAAPRKGGPVSGGGARNLGAPEGENPQ